MKKVITLTLVACIAFTATAMAQGSADKNTTAIGLTFPAISGESLADNKVNLPQAAAGKITLILIAFKRDSIPKLDPWVKAYADAFGANKDFAFYTIPMMKSSFAKQISGMINDKMKKDNPKELHDKIITYYGPVDEYVKVLGIDDEEKGYAFLLDKSGVVKWRSDGPADQNSIQSLIDAAYKIDG
jgi:hypothetical protein